MSATILRFLDRWRQPREDEHQGVDSTPAPGTQIRYSPDLINELKADHDLFFKLHDSLVDSLRSGQLTAVPALLQKFEGLLTGHLLTEQVRLYAYMDAYFSNDARTREMLRDYRIEMDRIGDSVRQMIRKYKALAQDRRLEKDFEKDLQELRRVLDERMSREESTLYPLYMPSTK